MFFSFPTQLFVGSPLTKCQVVLLRTVDERKLVDLLQSMAAKVKVLCRAMGEVIGTAWDMIN